MARRTESQANVTAGLFRRPEILVLADEMGTTVGEAVGLCIQFWLWVGEACTLEGDGDARLPHVSPGVVDLAVGKPGFADLLLSVRWLFVSGGDLVVPQYTKWNRPASYAAERAGRLRSRACVAVAAGAATPGQPPINEPVDVSGCDDSSVGTGEVQKVYFSGTKNPVYGAPEVQKPTPVPVTGSCTKKLKEPVTGTGAQPDRPLARIGSEQLGDPLAMLHAFRDCLDDPGLRLTDSTADRLAWCAQAARCRRTGGHPARLFCRSVVAGWWDRITGDDEHRARDALNELRQAGIDWETVDLVDLPEVRQTKDMSDGQKILSDGQDERLRYLIITQGRREKLPDKAIAERLAAAGAEW